MIAALAGTLASETIRMTVPYACAALGGIWSEKSGVVNIALEGMLLGSAFGAVAIQLATGSALSGLIGGAAVGAAMGALHAKLVDRGVDAIVSGIALNLGVAGGARFLLRSLYGSSSNSPAVHGFAVVPGTGAPGLLRTVSDPVTLLALAMCGVTAFCLARTRLGLSIRAAGENAGAAASLGIDVATVRLVAVTIGGAIAGMGGAALAFDQHQFQSGMSGGRGFIALAAVIVSGWRPFPAILACAVFALLDALQIVLQRQSRSSHDLVTALPYVATMVSLALIRRRESR